MSKHGNILAFFGKTSKQTKETEDSKSQSNKKGSKRRVDEIDDDDDVIPETPPNRDKKKKRTRGISSSDDDENFKAKPKCSKTSASSSKQTKKSPNKKSPQKKPEAKNLNIADLFGNAPVKRSKDSNENKDHESSKKIKTEIGIHDDEKFEKTLIDLDKVDRVAMSEPETTKLNGRELKTPVKNNEKHDHQSRSKTPLKNKDAKDGSINKESKNSEVENKNDKVRTTISSSKSPSKSNHRSGSASSKSSSSSRKETLPQNTNTVSSRTRSSSRTPQKVDTKSVSKSPLKKPSKLDLEKGSDKHKTRDDHKRKHRDESKNSTNDDKRSSSYRSPSKKVQNNAISPKVSNLDKKLAISKKLHGKKDFSMFINDDIPSSNSSDVVILDESTNSPQKDEQSDVSKGVTPKSDTKSKKRKTLDTSVSELTDEERMERRRHSAALFKSYQNRTGPKHPGSKEIPEGSPDCLAGFSFVITGVHDCFEKEELEETIKKFGGDVKKSMSKKVTHLLYGEDFGPKKMAQAEEYGTVLLTEDDFLKLIKDNTEKKSTDAVKKEPISGNKLKLSSPKKVPMKEDRVTEVKKEIEIKKDDIKSDAEVSQPTKTDSGISVTSLGAVSTDKDIPWVEKYKPQALKNVIGQQGDNSCVKKLLKWLSEWYTNRKKNLPKPNPWAGDKNNGGYYKAALLSGPPGVGKTTSVALVCKELGFDTVEFNASDTRSKNLLKEHLTDLVSSNSLAGFCHGKTGKGAVTKKHVVIMDEVDGMAGNEDRGGMQELLSLIKTTSVPIICMCNDKTSPKMRSLVSYCYDLTFVRPNVKQIQGAMMSVCSKEGVKIPPAALAQMIVGANQDIRQILNLLSVWSAADKVLSESGVSKDSKQAHKDMKMGPWEVVRKVFSQEEHKNMSIHDKSDLFFHDYSLGPLFVQQNYLKVVPKCDRKEVLERFAEAADCISLGDVVESKIRGNMAWSLLPLQAMYSSVMPGDLLEGHSSGQIEFPSWLGQNSRTNKMNRLAQELHSHTGLSTSGSKLAIRLDYARHLRDAVITPLTRDGSAGIHESIEILQDYHLLKEDLDSLLELTLWPGQRDPYSMVETKVKAALTRTYNKEATPLPYSQISTKKSKFIASSLDSGASSLDSGFYSAASVASPETVDVEEVEEEDDSDAEHDAMIKAKVSKPSSRDVKKASSSSKSNSKTKGKGKK